MASKAGRASDPLIGYQYRIEVSGTSLTGYFTECSGIGSENEVIEQKVQKKGVEVVIKLPGRLKWENITLKRGITSSMDLWKWRKMVEDGDVKGARKSGSIVMYDSTLTEKARWNFEGAWPSKISGPQPKADSNEIGLEEITIVHEYITRKK